MSRVPEPLAPSFDQLRVFLTVLETGSLAAAGSRLGRATSAISYALANLEAQLGLPLFERQATRRLALSEAGRVVAAEARDLARGMDGLRARVRGLLQGLEAELSLAVDVMLPTDRLVAALTAFQTEFPTVTVRLQVEALGAVAQTLLDGTASLAVSGPLDSVATRDLPRVAIGGVLMVPVAAPGHPLTRVDVASGDAARHLQLVLTDRSRLTDGQDFGVRAMRSWRLGDMSAKHALLRAGAGWGNMPEPMVIDDLASGRLVRLQLPDWPGVIYPLALLHRADQQPGPAARWLMSRLAS